MRVVFMGTPEFAVPSLEALLDKHEVVAAVTRPDAQKGRGQRVVFSPVKDTAIACGIPVLQPVKASDDGFIEELSGYHADVFVVVAFGMLLPESILRLPEKYGCINVHGSLLPKLRGAAPIQWSIINGEKTTGITIMHMDRGLDTGDMIIKEEIEITDTDTGGSLHDKMSVLGAQTLIRALDLLESGSAPRERQNHSEHTYAPMLTKEHGCLDWGNSADKIVNLVRGLNPWPSAYTYYNGELMKIWGARGIGNYESGAPGEIMGIVNDGLVVRAGAGSVVLTEVQARGSRRMPAADYLRGHRVIIGDTLGRV